MKFFNFLSMFFLSTAIFWNSCNRIEIPSYSDWSSKDRLCLNNRGISLCVDLKRGGCFDELHVDNHGLGPNIIDNPRDGGRQIQVSLYDGGDFYSVDNNWNGKWGWNPVQCGDRYGHGSRTIKANQVGDRIIETITQPLEWAGDSNGGAVESDVIIYQTIEIISDNSLMINYKVVHNGRDNHVGANHEFPVIYLKNPFQEPLLVLPDETTTSEGLLPVEEKPVKIVSRSILITTKNKKRGIRFTSSGDFYTVMAKDGFLGPGLVVQNWRKFDFVGKGSELTGFIILNFF